jgi:putative tryptophan/tyrosine transport system substrate-binding protein
MKRREFITLVGGAAASWPVVARAQQVPVIGHLSSTSVSNERQAAFHQGLKEAGFVHGQNLVVDYQAAHGQVERMQAMLATLLRRPVALIAANSVAARAAKGATAAVPIVFTSGSDPIRDGLVSSLNKPGGNVTGATYLNSLLGAKRLDLLRQIVPHSITIGALINPSQPETDAERTDLQTTAQKLGLQFHIMDIHTAADFEPAFATLVQRGVTAIIAGSGAFLFANRAPIVALAARHAIPVIYAWNEAVIGGGLMSYSASISDAFRQAGIYAGRILKGEKPGDLPVAQSTKFEFVINLATAKALGLDIHPQLLATADELIE